MNDDTGAISPEPDPERDPENDPESEPEREPDPERDPESEPGAAIIQWSWSITAVFVVAAGAATIAPDPLARPVAVLDLALFAAGVVVFVAAYVRAVVRSRLERITVTGTFLLSGTAPPEVRQALLGAVAVQALVAIVTSAIRLYTPVAFGVLVPVLGLGLAGLWGSRHGTFPRRDR